MLLKKAKEKISKIIKPYEAGLEFNKVSFDLLRMKILSNKNNGMYITVSDRVILSTPKQEKKNIIFSNVLKGIIDYQNSGKCEITKAVAAVKTNFIVLQLNHPIKPNIITPCTGVFYQFKESDRLKISDKLIVEFLGVAVDDYHSSNEYHNLKFFAYRSCDMRKIAKSRESLVATLHPNVALSSSRTSNIEFEDAAICMGTLRNRSSLEQLSIVDIQSLFYSITDNSAYRDIIFDFDGKEVSLRRGDYHKLIIEEKFIDSKEATENYPKEFLACLKKQTIVM